METEAWLFDVYPKGRGMVVWFITPDGQKLRLEDTFRPSLYARAKPRDLIPLLRELETAPYVSALEFTKRTDLLKGERVEVLRIEVADLNRFQTLPDELLARHPRVKLYNAGIHLGQMYFYEKRTFPLAFCQIHHDGKNLLGVEVHDDPWALDYTLPPLKVMILKATGRAGRFSQAIQALEVTVEGMTHRLEEGREEDLLLAFREMLVRHDPDVILTEHGDTFIFPVLLQAAKEWGVEIPLDREVVRRGKVREGNSFFTYGKVVYLAPAYPLYGRYHIDLCNSMVYGVGELEGLYEICRLGKVPVQRQARLSTGVTVTSLQMDHAIREGILIPWKKAQAESLKTYRQLWEVDKGGLVDLPQPGLHENIAELDFSSMYPSLIYTYNISPEIVNCRCCPPGDVPEAGYSLCKRREGLLPRVLKPVIEKRRAYKRLMRAAEGEERHRYDLLQQALRWIGLVSFGYLGYRNFRWSRIEAHEATTALGREMLLRAREIAEASGYRVVHSLVDALYVTKEAMTEEGLNQLAQEIQAATQIPISLEGIYKWIVFCVSRDDPLLPVPIRYYGVFRDGTQKLRGLELRRHDTPPIVGAAQQAMIDVLAEADGAKEFRAKIPQALEAFKGYLQYLRDGKATWPELLITRTLTKAPNEYLREDVGAVAAKQMDRAGITLHPGEQISYVILNTRAKVKAERARPAIFLTGDESYDKEKYVELLLRAAETLLAPLGYPAERIQSWLETS